MNTPLRQVDWQERCYTERKEHFNLDYLKVDPEVIQYINDSKSFLKLYSNCKTPYTEYLKALHHYIKPRHYLEIGVNDGLSFSLADKDISAHGVDTKIKIQGSSDGHKLYEMTSDEYFARELNKKTQLSFVDGLHTAKQAFIDFVNCYNSTELHGVIVIDDICPESLFSCQPFRVDSIWHGDVLRIITMITNIYPGIILNIINCWPGGLAVVRKENVGHLTIPNNIEEIISNTSILKCFLERNKWNMCNITPHQIGDLLK